MAKAKRIEDIAASLLAQTKPRAKSLIVTVFGDAIAPHGGTVWLGSLIALLAPFGINERLVRTAVLRLGREDWLAARQIGRRSYYSLTGSGQQRFEDAHRKIYAFERGSWPGEWHIVFTGLSALTARERERLKNELTWQGFGVVAPSMLAHPNADPLALRHVLQEIGVVDRVALMRARSDVLASGNAMRDLVRSAWNLDSLSRAYREFLEFFHPVSHTLEYEESPNPLASLLARVLLIHEYRRILLRDPQLPEELLPKDWTGTAARLLCRNIYRRLAEPTERYLVAFMKTAEGPLPEAAPYFYDRFGGLRDRFRARESAAE